MANPDILKIHVDNHICLLTLNRPEARNALNAELSLAIVEAILDADENPDVFMIAFTGAGDKAFCSGADLREAHQRAESGKVVRGPLRSPRRVMTEVLIDAKKPSMAIINGPALAGGFELALACDLRVAAEGSSFAITSSRIGTVAGAGGTQRLPRIVGIANALDILFSAETFDAHEAHRIGLINRLAPTGGALDAALAMIKIYAQRAPLSLALVKRAVHRGMQMDLASAIEFETYLVTTIYGTDDKNEGISAFLEKRTPRFEGK